MTSVRFLERDEVRKLREIHVPRDYLDATLAEVDASNRAITEATGVDVPANRRWLTNLGTFRAYVERYLAAHPQVNHEMTCIVRQLQPTSQGLPLELYLFTNDTRWAYYEVIQADIFDQLLAIVGEFDLRVFQTAAGSDVREAVRAPPRAPRGPHGVGPSRRYRGWNLSVWPSRVA